MRAREQGTNPGTLTRIANKPENETQKHDADQKARGRYLGGKIPFGFRLGDDGELVPHN